MGNLTTRRIVIIILIILTLGLGALSVYVGLNLNQEDVAPDDSSADTGIGENECLPDASSQCAAGLVAVIEDFEEESLVCHDFDDIKPGAQVKICEKSVGAAPPPTSSLDDPKTDDTGDDCFIDNPSVVDSYIDIGEFCEASKITLDDRYSETATDENDDGDITSQDCIGTNANRTDLNASPGNRYQPGGSCGVCEQIDIVYDGVEFGTARYAGDCPVVETEDPIATTQCVSGESKATLTWELEAGSGQLIISVDDDSNFDDDGFWRRTMPVGTTSVVIPNGFDGVDPESGRLELEEGTRYYVRIRDDGNDIVYSVISFVARDCTTPVVPGCSETCTSTTQCPTNHVCDTTTDTCVLSQCINNNPECLQNGCALPLPDTAIFGEKYDKFLLGIMMILLGILVVKVDVMGGMMNLLSNIEIKKPTYKPITKQNGIEKKVKRSRKKFEKKFEK